MNVRFRKALGLVVVVLFLAALAGTATAASLDLPRWVIVPEDNSFSDVTLFCGLDDLVSNGDGTYNVTGFRDGVSIIALAIDTNTTNTNNPALVAGVIGNAIHFGGEHYIQTTTFYNYTKSYTVALWFRTTTTGYLFWISYSSSSSAPAIAARIYSSTTLEVVNLVPDSVWLHWYVNAGKTITDGEWHFLVIRYDVNSGSGQVILDGQILGTNTQTPAATNGARLVIGAAYNDYTDTPYGFFTGDIDEFRAVQRYLTDDEIKLLYLAGRKKLSEPAQFRQIFSPMIDLTSDRATFYAGLEVSTSDPNGYVPVPESATNMSITSAPKLTSDYTGAPFYYEGHFWYQAQDIQYSLPIQFETVRQDGNFSHTVLLDEDKKTFVYEKEFKVTNPTGARINVVYEINPLQLGFSALQYPSFELDGVRMVSWRPNNSSTPLLIATDTLEPGEVSTHWLKSTWTISKEELNFPAKLDDFRSISNWTVARKLAENAAEGKVDTYVRVIKIDSTADMSNMTVLVPLKDVKDENDVIEATALTGARDTLQVEKLSDGKVVVKVPGQDFVSGHAEIKVLYNKSGGSWFSQLLEKIRSLMKKILSMFGLGGG